MEELKYGLLDGNLVHIDDVEKGLACDCLCPHCKGRLIAKKGEKRAKHFAHYKVADCNHGTETALHLMAKNIIGQTRKVFVPFIPKTACDYSKGGKVLTFEKAVVEKQLSDTVRGDVVLYNGESFLNIEVNVTHKVDPNKVIELFNLGIPTIEIDFSDIKSDFTSEAISQRIISGEHTRLINSPKNKEIFAIRILGEFKQVHEGRWVDDCPLSGEKAYFVDINHRGGRYECHDCGHFGGFTSGGCKDCLLCFGAFSVDFGEIDKILHLEKEENRIRSVKLLMCDGSIEERPRRG